MTGHFKKVAFAEHVAKLLDHGDTVPRSVVDAAINGAIDVYLATRKIGLSRRARRVIDEIEDIAYDNCTRIV